ncbi:MAG: 50S ribosomal protein L21 [Bacteroidetes bacterium]|nr:50S ribosomal protein L21 [Bacteroidota bacterium]
MYAIVDIAGQQFKVREGQQLFVHRLQAEEGSQITLDKVMLVEHDGQIEVGTPVVENAKITAKVLGHLKGDKVLVFKKKRRKGYQTLNGHRQSFSKVQIESISL